VGFPHADTGVEDFPAVDAGLADFPGPDVGFEDFPPAPVMLVYADVSFTLTPAAVWAVLPWRTADVVFSMSPGVSPVASVVLEAAAGLVMTPIAAIIPDELFPTVSFTMTPDAVVEHAGVVEAGAGLSMSPGMAEIPVAVVTADAITTMTVTADVAIAGVIGAAAGLSMSPAVAPVASLDATAVASLAMAPDVDYEVITFIPSGMTKSGASSRLGTSFAQVDGTWAADTTNYPGSTVDGGDLVIQRSATGVTIEASVVWTTHHAFGNRDIYMQLRQGASTILATTVTPLQLSQSSSGTLSLTATNVTVTAGDKIRLEARCNLTNSISAQPNAASYVRATRP